MGSSDVSQKFTFNETSGTSGLTSNINGVITMDIVSNANGIHEAAHGYQFYMNGGKGFAASNNLGIEVTAYQRQYSFDSTTR